MSAFCSLCLSLVDFTFQPTYAHMILFEFLRVTSMYHHHLATNLTIEQSSDLRSIGVRVTHSAWLTRGYIGSISEVTQWNDNSS